MSAEKKSIEMILWLSIDIICYINIHWETSTDYCSSYWRQAGWRCDAQVPVMLRSWYIGYESILATGRHHLVDGDTRADGFTNIDLGSGACTVYISFLIHFYHKHSLFVSSFLWCRVSNILQWMMIVQCRSLSLGWTGLVGGGWGGCVYFHQAATASWFIQCGGTICYA